MKWTVKERTDDNKITKVKQKYLINIVNVYAPTSQRLEKHQNELGK